MTEKGTQWFGTTVRRQVKWKRVQPGNRASSPAGRGVLILCAGIARH